MSIVDTTKDIYELIKKGASIDTQEKLMQLREEALALQEENLELRQRVSELEAANAIGKELEFDGRVYWQCKGDQKEGPFCPQCFDNDEKIIRLQHIEGQQGYHDPYWKCKTCENFFGSR